VDAVNDSTRSALQGAAIEVENAAVEYVPYAQGLIPWKEAG